MEVDRIEPMATRFKHDVERVFQFANKVPGPHAVKANASQPEEGASPTGKVEVRQMRLADCGSISRFNHRFELMYPESASDRPGQFGLMVRRLLTGEYSSSPIFVARDRETKRYLGMLQCQQQGVDDRWYLHYLASQEEVKDGNPTHVALLEHAIAQAGWRGARRVMARSSAASPLTGTLRSTGFSAFAREYVYSMPWLPEGGTAGHVRLQEKSDVWSIHQLYLQTTPRDVQNAEALTSHVWDVDTEGRSRRGWFIPTNSGASAYIRVRTTRRFHLLDAMYQPEALPHMPDLFHAVFHALRAETSRPIFISARGYQQELGTLLESLGFGLQTDQLMMVRYTTVPVPASVRPAEAFERLRAVEPDARRVPSFYVRDVHD